MTGMKVTSASVSGSRAIRAMLRLISTQHVGDEMPGRAVPVGHVPARDQPRATTALMLRRSVRVARLASARLGSAARECSAR